MYPSAFSIDAPQEYDIRRCRSATLHRRAGVALAGKSAHCCCLRHLFLQRLFLHVCSSEISD